jgi:hypothetical protein
MYNKSPIRRHVLLIASINHKIYLPWKDTSNKTDYWRHDMDEKAKLHQLLQDYGYPQEAISRFLKDTEELNYDEARKRIMPYKDITAER